MLVDKASLLTLSVPEMTVLVGGMRALGANTNGNVGVLTDKPGTLTNDFFINLLNMGTKWSKSSKSDAVYEGRDRKTNKLKWTASSVDLVFGSNSELRLSQKFMHLTMLIRNSLMTSLKLGAK